MRILNIPISEELLFVLKKDEQSLQEEARKILAMQFFKERKLSLGRAAELAGMGGVIMKNNDNKKKSRKKPLLLETYVTVLKPAPKDSRPSLRLKWFSEKKINKNQ